MYNLKNLTNSPYLIPIADGTNKMLPARGELLGADIHPAHVGPLKICGYIVLSEIETEKKLNTLESLRQEYTEITGEQPDGRWSKKKLEHEIDKAWGTKL